jgi:glycosyltransferase involved in cell wall biosynthesis
VRVLPNTFDESRYQPGEKPRHLMQRLGIQPGQKVMLTVSRLSASERYKGHDMVLCALARLSEVEPGLCYIIAGEGEYKKSLMQMAAELGVSDRVYFPGFIPSAELPDYYRLCDLFIMPSTKEGFGIVFMEAMAAGKPVIGGNVDGSADALADGELGVLVSPGNVEQIAREILRVLRHEHPNRLLYDAQGLRKAVCARFGWKAFVKNVSEIVKPLMR